MELKATQVGRHFARHPYNRAAILNAGIEVSGESHKTIIPFTQLIAMSCKRGIIWGELEFELKDNQVVRLHGTEWSLTQAFYKKAFEAWEAWGGEMSSVCDQILNEQVTRVERLVAQKNFLTSDDVDLIQQDVDKTLRSLPILAQRLPEFGNCKDAYQYCRNWLENGESARKLINRMWTDKCLEDNSAFFNSFAPWPLTLAQCRAVLSINRASLIIGGAGSGKTAVLVARAGWLLHSSLAKEEHILILASGDKTAEGMRQRLNKLLPKAAVEVKTFQSLALEIVQSNGGKKTVNVSELDTNMILRHRFLFDTVKRHCEQKKSYANGWREWIEQELCSPLDVEPFWKDNVLMARLVTKIDQWLRILRSQTFNQTEWLANASEDMERTLIKRLRLLQPILKEWRSELKRRKENDVVSLVTKATHLLNKGTFQGPWQHILIDDYQDLSFEQMALIEALRSSHSETPFLFAVGDDWQATDSLSLTELSLARNFEERFRDAQTVVLDTTHRFNQRIADITNQFIQFNPNQIKKALDSRLSGKKDSVTILPQEQLENLLDKLSGFVKAEQKIFVLARYYYLYPDIVKISNRRWPKLAIEFMTIDDCKGRQADFVIIIGLQNGNDGFPEEGGMRLMTKSRMPILDADPNAKERRLLYVALTRAKNRVWLMKDRENPSVFINELKRLGALERHKA